MCIQIFYAQYAGKGKVYRTDIWCDSVFEMVIQAIQAIVIQKSKKKNFAVLLSNGEVSYSFCKNKWGISCGTLAGQPRPSSPRANLHPTQAIRPNVLKILTLHAHKIHIVGQNALVGILAGIPNYTWLNVISLLPPPPIPRPGIYWMPLKAGKWCRHNTRTQELHL